MGSLCTKTRSPESLAEMEEEARLNRKVDKNLYDSAELKKDTVRLLLLGTGESGKSTIFKQVKRLYSNELLDSELRTFIPMIHMNICAGLISLKTQRQKKRLDLENPSAELFFQSRFSKLSTITPELAQSAKNYWKEIAIQNLWQHRNEFQIWDSFEYFMEQIDEICLKTYTPSLQDVLNCRVPTIGIQQHDFKMDKTKFTLVDVGGQRGERRVWLPLFEQIVHGIIFVAAINEFDQELYEKAGVNRVQESLSVWKEFGNLPGFDDIGYILFLNKLDLFERKVCQVKFRNEEKGINLGYQGPEPSELEGEEQLLAIESCKNFMKDLFLNQIETERRKSKIDVHFTTATDTKIMKHVLDNCQRTLIEREIVKRGFAFEI